jgi:hypothetical protein
MNHEPTRSDTKPNTGMFMVLVRVVSCGFVVSAFPLTNGVKFDLGSVFTFCPLPFDFLSL